MWETCCWKPGCKVGIPTHAWPIVAAVTPQNASEDSLVRDRHGQASGKKHRVTHQPSLKAAFFLSVWANRQPCIILPEKQRQALLACCCEGARRIPEVKTVHGERPGSSHRQARLKALTEVQNTTEFRTEVQAHMGLVWFCNDRLPQEEVWINHVAYLEVNG